MRRALLVRAGLGAVVVALVGVVVWQGLMIHDLHSRSGRDEKYIYTLARAVKAMQEDQPADLTSQVEEASSGVSDLDGRVGALEKQVATLCQHLQELSSQAVGSYYLCP